MRRNNDNNKQKHLTLRAFNFTKAITHRNREISVEFPKIARIETKHVKCPNCDKSSVNNQGFSGNLKCVHSSSRVNNENLLSQSTMVVRKETLDPVLVETRSVLSEMVGEVVGNDGKAPTAKQQPGKKRRQYSATFTAEVINMMEQPGNTKNLLPITLELTKSEFQGI